MGNNEKTAIRLLNDLVDFQNGAPLDRHKEEYDKLMNEIYAFLDDIADREIIESVIDSHSPTTEQYDTLQEGDYVENLSEKQLEKLLDIEGDSDDVRFKWHEGIGLVFYGGILYTTDGETKKISTKLTPEEFLLRAENTFKTK